jgi:hypothetical protein
MSAYVSNDWSPQAACRVFAAVCSAAGPLITHEMRLVHEEDIMDRIITCYECGFPEGAAAARELVGGDRETALLVYDRVGGILQPGAQHDGRHDENSSEFAVACVSLVEILEGSGGAGDPAVFEPDVVDETFVEFATGPPQASPELAAALYSAVRVCIGSGLVLPSAEAAVTNRAAVAGGGPDQFVASQFIRFVADHGLTDAGRRRAGTHLLARSPNPAQDAVFVRGPATHDVDSLVIYKRCQEARWPIPLLSSNFVDAALQEAVANKRTTMVSVRLIVSLGWRPRTVPDSIAARDDMQAIAVVSLLLRAGARLPRNARAEHFETRRRLAARSSDVHSFAFRALPEELAAFCASFIGEVGDALLA